MLTSHLLLGSALLALLIQANLGANEDKTISSTEIGSFEFFLPFGLAEQHDTGFQQVRNVQSLTTDQEAISQEIQRIDAAIADIDNAMDSQRFDDNEQDLPERQIVSVKQLVPLDQQIPSTSPPAHLVDSEVSDQVAFSDGQQVTSSDAQSVTSSAAAVSSEQASSTADLPATSADQTADQERELLERFKAEEGEYKNHPTQPRDTRRFFEFPPGELQFKIASMANLDQFVKHHHMSGQINDKEGVCSSTPDCDFNEKYRSFDGSCNNIKDPSLGSTLTFYQRLTTPAYGDGSGTPRGVDRWTEDQGYVSRLPSPRDISDKIMTQDDETETQSSKNTHMVMQFGQFLAHDMADTASQPADCCQQTIRNLSHCFSIPVSDADTFYSSFGKRCLDFTRSDAHCNRKLAAREQMNKQTAFIDGSAIYGNSQDLATKLRGKKKNGTMAVNSQLSSFLPSKFDLNIHKGLDQPTDFVAGDDRAESQASLTSLHNLWLNEHNRIAEFMYKELRGRSSLSDQDLDELVYQETRRLVIGELQKVAFSEFLPEVIGASVITSLKIDDPACVYDPEVNPTIFNSFITAAFRFGHSLIQSIFRGDTQPWRLGKFYADSRFARGEGGKAFVHELVGLASQPCQKADLHMTKQVTNFLYCNNKTAPGGGHDIASINIQRGRDHGIPAYNVFRSLCGLEPAQNFETVPSGVNQESWAKIGSVYESVDDVDLWVGGLAEEPSDGMVGPTFACIIGKQLKVLMDGDRYFYHHTGGPNIFPLTGAALSEMSSRSLACIICDNTDVQSMPSNVFRLEQDGNTPKSCNEHPKMDLAKIVAEIQA